MHPQHAVLLFQFHILKIIKDSFFIPLPAQPSHPVLVELPFEVKGTLEKKQK